MAGGLAVAAHRPVRVRRLVSLDLLAWGVGLLAAAWRLSVRPGTPAGMDEPDPFALITQDPRLRREERGEFPAHGDPPGHRVFTAQEAAARARARLENWRRDHGQRH